MATNFQKIRHCSVMNVYTNVHTSIQLHWLFCCIIISYIIFILNVTFISLFLLFSQFTSVLKLFFNSYQTSKQTRMKTSISSKAICSITDRQTDKIFTEQMLIYEGNRQKKIGAISQLGAEKITFPPKPDIQTDGHRVALLLKRIVDRLHII